MSLTRSSKQYLGVRATAPPNLQIAARAPTSADKSYVKGNLWLDTAALSTYMWPGSGNWIALGTGAVGGITTLTGGSGGPIAPVAGNISVLGTAAQITSTGTAGTITLSTPAIFTAPGSIASTTTIASGTTMTAGTGLAVTTGGILVSGGDIVNSHAGVGTDVTMEVTNTNNANAASRAGVEIATGGASSGDPYLRFEISGVGASTMTMGLDNSASDLFVISNSSAIGTSNALSLTQAGALTATTTLTASSGAITATNGNFVGTAAGTGILLNSPAASGVAASPVVVNGRSGQATFTSVNINFNTDLTLTITNSAITGASTQVLLSMSGSNNDAVLMIKSVTPSAGSLAIVVRNYSGGTASTADIVITFLVLN